MNYVFFFIIITPLVGALITSIFPDFKKEVSFFSSLITFNFSLILYIFFDISQIKFQYINAIKLLNFFDSEFYIGVDGLSLVFLILTTFLIPICFLFSWKSNEPTSFYTSFLFLEFFLLVSFTTLDVMVFYVFFEAVLIPIFFIIGSLGSRDRKVRAGFLLFIYTLTGSLFMLMGVIFLLSETGTSNYLLLIENTIPLFKQKVLWLLFFFAFSIKIPLYPVHVWLPEAHVESPTCGSVILAGILLKLGAYGFLRFLIPLFPIASVFFKPLVFTIGILSVVYASFVALRQIDMKRVIAYASISHIGLIVVSIFSFNPIGIISSIFQLISHGIVSSALFFCVGILYTRFGTRIVKYFSGLVHTMPIFVFFFLFFCLGNIGFPGTSSFVGELLMLLSLFFENIYLAIVCSSSLILSGFYTLFLFNRISYGNLKVNYVSFSRDLIECEFFTLISLFSISIFIGLNPSPCFDILFNFSYFISDIF
ncbi:hypothetical protein AB834_03720 [PVC group bacterium (ex Bugula neritina AB1)]|nr:hypothetical protein AB834_03720 [PVC group bacterium (ex Bugula neritina AB1)]